MEIIYKLMALFLGSLGSVALADLIPEMHRKTSNKASISQFLLITLGILIIYVSIHLK